MTNLSWWKRLTKIERNLGMFVCCGCILCIGLIIGIVMILLELNSCATVDIELRSDFDLVDEYDGDEEMSKVHVADINMCVTPTCIHAASDILKNMDTNVQPCDNFYRFACGNFHAHTPIPDDRSVINSFALIEMQMQEKLARAFRRLDPNDDRRHLRLLGNLYKSCMDRRTIALRGVEPLLTILKDLGGWPVLEGEDWDETTFQWTESVYKFRAMGLATDYFIAVTVTVDLHNNTGRVLHLKPPLLGLTREYFVNDINYKVMQAYRQYMIDIAVLLGASEEAANEELAQSLEFEEALAKASQPSRSRRKIIVANNPMTVGELSEKYPNIPFKDYLNKLLAPMANVEDDEVIIVNVPVYLLNFERLITETPLRTQANYVMWRAVAASVTYLTEELRVKQMMNNEARYGTTTRTSRWRECVRIISDQLPFSVSSLYIKEYFDDHSKVKAQDMLRKIKYKFTQNLMQLDWMDAETRKSAILKATSMASRVGYPAEIMDDTKLDEFYQDLELSSHSYFENILNVTRFDTNYRFSLLRKPNNRSAWTNNGDVVKINGQYVASENTIKIPASILQGRYFDKNRPKYMNFGGIGIIMAHEVTHGFDDKGRQYGKQGNLVDWWAESTDQHFSGKVNCIVDQYNQYYVSEVGKNVNGLYTCNENIADNGGMKISYLAYRDWAAKNYKENLLPGLNYTPQQMFWISAANSWCTKRRSDFFKFAMIKDNHSPPEFRVIGSFSNMKEFARDFHCSVGSTMNPEHKCVIW